MPIVPIRKTTDDERTKVIESNQKAIDALPFDSGTWRVEGVPGLYLRCRAKTKSFFIQRRVGGLLVKETLGELSMKRARAAAMSTWSKMRPKPAKGQEVTLAAALDMYLLDKQLAEKTRHNYRYNAEHYLEKWTGRSLQEIGMDRAGVRVLQRQITKEHGVATSNQVVRLISCVYRWARKEDTSLPEPPTTAVEVQRIPARNWALSPKELKAWWYADGTQGQAGQLGEAGRQHPFPDQAYVVDHGATDRRAGRQHRSVAVGKPRPRQKDVSLHSDEGRQALFGSDIRCVGGVAACVS
jgi:hypothetical protein